MAQMSPGAALRQVQQAHAGLRKARRALLLIRGDDAGPQARHDALRVGWDSLAQAHRLLAALPLRVLRGEILFSAMIEVPDRPLEPPGVLPTVAIRAPGRHPFVYRKMIAGPVGGPRPRDGDLVRVVDRAGRPVGFGLWNGHSE